MIDWWLTEWLRLADWSLTELLVLADLLIDGWLNDWWLSDCLIKADWLMLADMWTDHLPVLQKELSELTAKCERYIGTEGGGMDQAISLMAHHGMVSLQSCILQCNTVITLLPSVSAVVLGMFCGAKYTHHTFMPVVKHETTTASGKKSFLKNAWEIQLTWYQAVQITSKLPLYEVYLLIITVLIKAVIKLLTTN